MEAPFIFGKLAESKNFTNRQDEIDRLITNFESAINTTLISPRRWGKSSLVLRAAEEVTAKNKQIKACFVDVFDSRSEEQFYQSFAKEVLKSTSGKIEEIGDFAKKFLSKMIPKISFSPDNMQDISISLDWEELKRDPSEVLDLGEKIAKEKGIKLIICLDEFQGIADYKNSKAFQKRLRSRWQKHQNVSYCLYGSKRHMMMDIFTKQSMPFYKFGDLMFLEKISKEDWIPFIQSQFASTKKKIGDKEAGLIADLVECHPYYVQQLAQLSWLRTKTSCKKSVIYEAHDSLMMQLSLLFQNMTSDVSITQLNFLKALMSGEKKLSSKDVLTKYELGTSANISRVKKALANKEILDLFANKVTFTDPVYKAWLEKYFFKL